ncbi:MAG: hypothetical protein AAB953_00155 [Patescibacteria group bacterium]
MKKLIFITVALFFSACNNNPISQENNFSNIFTNEKYLYAFQYPSKAYFRDNDTLNYPSQSTDVSIYLPESGDIFNIKVTDENLDTDLEKYVKQNWQMEKTDMNENIKKTVGELKTETLEGRVAYQFLLEENYQNFDGDFIKEENIHIFTKYNKTIYEIRYPSKNRNSENILNSLKFIMEEKTPVTNQQANIDNCGKNYEKEKDQCLLTYIKKEILYEGTPQSDSSVCQAVTVNTQEQKECYWLFALQNKKNSECELIPSNQEETYFTRENCKKELQYENDQAQWKLAFGYPPYIDQPGNDIVYFGQADIQGWLSEENNKQIYFNILIESKKNLPPYLQRYSQFNLEYCDFNKCFLNMPEEILSKFKKYTKENPAKISISRLSMGNDDKIPTLVIEDMSKN